MKGEEVPQNALWGGNPAVELPGTPGDGSGSATAAGTSSANGAAATVN
jgi:hypothetical protein